MALEGQVITCKTVDEWRENLARANDSKKLVVAYFTAAWCPPCRMIAPVVEDLAKKFTFVLFLKVDVDELKTVAEEWEVEAMPTFIFIKEGNVVHRVVGAVKDELVAAITKHGSA